MNASLRRDVDTIVAGSIRAVPPDEAVRRALGEYKPGAGKTPLVAAGKAAWQMARAAADTLGHVDGGVVVTKYDHVRGRFPAWPAMRPDTRSPMRTASPPPGGLRTW